MFRPSRGMILRAIPAGDLVRGDPPIIEGLISRRFPLFAWLYGLSCPALKPICPFSVQDAESRQMLPDLILRPRTTASPAVTILPARASSSLPQVKPFAPNPLISHGEREYLMDIVLPSNVGKKSQKR